MINTPELLGAVGGMLVSFFLFITTLLNNKRIKLEKTKQEKVLVEKTNDLKTYKERIDDPVKESELELSKTKGISVLLLGIGGVGKTAIIKALTGMTEANPAIKTTELATYMLVKETEYNVNLSESGVELPERSLTRIYLDDTIGQNLNIGFKNDRLRTERAKIIENTVVVLVVDLFPQTMQKTTYKVPNQSRINQNIRAWEKTSLQAIRDVKNPSTFVLFINKVDQLEFLSDAAIENAKEKYKDLMKEITKYLVTNKPPYIDKDKVITIVGSAARGLGVCGDSVTV